MRNYENEIVNVTRTVSIICDVCQVEHDDPIEMEEFLSFNNFCGYGSVFGDGNRINFDMCQQCVKEMLGKYIRVSESDYD